MFFPTYTSILLTMFFTMLLLPIGLKLGGVKPVAGWSWVWVTAPIWICTIVGTLGLILGIRSLRSWIGAIFKRPEPIPVLVQPVQPVQPVQQQAPVYARQAYYRSAYPVYESHVGRKLLIVAAIVAAIFAIQSEKCHAVAKLVVSAVGGAL